MPVDTRRSKRRADSDPPPVTPSPHAQRVPRASGDQVTNKLPTAQFVSDNTVVPPHEIIRPAASSPTAQEVPGGTSSHATHKLPQVPIQHSEPDPDHLAHLDESTGFSFAEFCQVAGRLDLLRDTARERGDLVTWAGALIGDSAD